MHDICKFHSVHGSGIELDEAESVARRCDDFCYGIVFSKKPLTVRQNVCLEVSHSLHQWSGGVLRVGVTSHNPAHMQSTALPRFAIPALTSQPGYWACALNELCTESSSDKVVVWLDGEGHLQVTVNSHPPGGHVLLSGLPLDNTPLWLMLDVFGATTTVKVIPAGNIELFCSSRCIPTETCT